MPQALMLGHSSPFGARTTTARSVQGTVYQRPEFLADGVGRRWYQLGHEDHHHVLYRVHKEAGAGQSAPAEFAFGADGGGTGNIGFHRKAQPEPAAGIGCFAEAANRKPWQVLAARQVVQAHEFQGLTPDDALALILAALAEGLGEAEIVINGGDQPTAAGQELGLLQITGALRIVLQLHGVSGLVQIAGGETLLLVRPHLKAGVGHAQWLENVLTEVRIQWLAGQQLNQVTQYIGGYGIVPRGAR